MAFLYDFVKLWDMTELEKIVNSTEGKAKEAMLELVHSLAEKIRENNRLSQHVDQLKHEVKLLKKKIFGASSEKSNEPVSQDDIFNEFELCLQELELEEVNLPEAASTPKPRKKSGRQSLPKTLSRQIVVHDLPEEEKNCACCGEHMTSIGDKVSEELEYQPAQFRVIENRRKQYACHSCQTNQDERGHEQSAEPKPTIKTAKQPAKLIPKSLATPSLLAAIVVAKYADHLPLYRLERIFQRESIHLTRQTMSQWVIKASAAVIPLINLLEDNVLNYDIAFADETSIQVLKEPGRRAQNKSYIWCFIGGPPGKRSIIYQYHETREAKATEQFFEGYQGGLHCDGYAGYQKLIASEKITGINCLAHVRRKFMEALPSGKEKGVAGHVVKLIRALYQIESELTILKADTATIQKVRNEKSKPILETLKAYLEEKKPCLPKESPTGKAIDYTLKRWPYLMTYLKDGRFEIDNNRSERAIKPFTIGRKNWLFANTPLGAHASARLYSLIESAKANRVEPRAYLQYIFKELPLCQSVEDYEVLLPWNLTEQLPDYHIEHP